MFVFLLIVILLAVLGVLGLALKIAAALVLGVVIAVTTVVFVGYLLVRRQLRRAQRSMGARLGGASAAASETTVEIGEPHRGSGSGDAGIDERY